jgi:hypothetical protein
MMEEAGPQITEVIGWSYTKAQIYDGTGRPPNEVLAGPKALLVRCTRCDKGPWRATKGPDVFKEHLFCQQGPGVRVCCDTCGQNRRMMVQDLPGYAEANRR